MGRAQLLHHDCPRQYMYKRMAARAAQKNIAASVLEEACIAEQQNCVEEKHARVHELYAYTHIDPLLKCRSRPPKRVAVLPIMFKVTRRACSCVKY